MLHMKMLTKMILSEINDQREVILKEANAFVKKQKDSFKVVTNDNVNDNQDLLDKITERIDDQSMITVYLVLVLLCRMFKTFYFLCLFDNRMINNE